MGIRTVTAVATASMLLAGCAGTTDPDPEAGAPPETVDPETERGTVPPDDDLWDRTYEAVDVDAPGSGLELAEDTRIRLTLTRGTPWEEGDLARDEGADGFAEWHAGCNRFGQHFRFSGDRFEFSGGSAFTTDMLCPDLLEQDQWVNGFFNADPSWELDDGTLELATDAMTISFEVAGDAHGDRPWLEPRTVTPTSVLQTPLPNELAVEVPSCNAEPVVDILEEDEEQVRIRIVTTVADSGDDCLDGLRIVLDDPLDGRTLIDHFSGQPIDVGP